MTLTLRLGKISLGEEMRRGCKDNADVGRSHSLDLVTLRHFLMSLKNSGLQLRKRSFEKFFRYVVIIYDFIIVVDCFL